MKTDLDLAAHADTSNDKTLANLEVIWRLAIDAFEAACESGFNESALDPIARRIEDAERRIASTPASSPRGVAVKLRMILRHETSEAEKRHWYAALQSALMDLEEFAAQTDRER